MFHANEYSTNNEHVLIVLTTLQHNLICLMEFNRRTAEKLTDVRTTICMHAMKVFACFIK